MDHNRTFTTNPGYLRRRRRRGESRQRSERRFQEKLARYIRAQRTAERLGVQLIAWGVCPRCGCIGAPNHGGASAPCIFGRTS